MGEDQKSFFPILTQDCSTEPLILQGIILATVKVAKSFCFCCYAWHVLLSEDTSQWNRGWRAAPLHVSADEPEETRETLDLPQPPALICSLV